jgi:hypothetical protein
MESLRENHGDYFVNQYKGWFIAPETTKYRFWMSCERNCEFKLGKTPGENAKDVEKLLYTDSPSARSRFYWDHNFAWGAERKRISDWKSLEKGKAYYIESYQSDWTNYR